MNSCLTVLFVQIIIHITSYISLIQVRFHVAQFYLFRLSVADSSDFKNLMNKDEYTKFLESQTEDLD